MPGPHHWPDVDASGRCAPDTAISSRGATAYPLISVTSIAPKSLCNSPGTARVCGLPGRGGPMSETHPG